MSVKAKAHGDIENNRTLMILMQQIGTDLICIHLFNLCYLRAIVFGEGTNRLMPLPHACRLPPAACCL
jgi:hypothetical protein